MDSFTPVPLDIEWPVLMNRYPKSLKVTRSYANQHLVYSMPLLFPQ